MKSLACALACWPLSAALALTAAHAAPPASTAATIAPAPATAPATAPTTPRGIALIVTQDAQLPPAWRLAIEPVLAAQLQAPGSPPQATRLEIHLGAPDPRLRLAPCTGLQAQWPQSQRPASTARVGLRCTEGVSKWSAYLPVRLAWYGPAWVSTGPRPAGHVLVAADMALADVQLNASASPAPTHAAELQGRILALPLVAGQTLREDSLRARQWFAAGDTVQVQALSQGMTVTTQGEAITPGVQGRPARVRLEGGKIVTGEPMGERLLVLRW